LSVAQGGSFDLIIGNGASIEAKGGRLIFKAPEGIEILSNSAITTHSSILTHNGKDIGSTHKHLDVTSGPDLTGYRNEHNKRR